MIWRYASAGVALCLSVALHGAGLLFFDSAPVIAPVSAAKGVAQLGNSFDDMVAGVTSPPSPTTDAVKPDDNISATAPEEIETGQEIDFSEGASTEKAVSPRVEPTLQPTTPETTQATPVQDTADPGVTTQTRAVETPAPEPAEIAPVTPDVAKPAPIETSTATPVLQTTEPTPAAAETPTLSPSASVAASSVATSKPSIAEATTPPPPTQIQPASPPQQTIAAVADDASELAIPVSRRPTARPAGPATTASGPPPRAGSVGNSTTNARRGETTATNNGADTVEGAGDGNAPSAEQRQAAAQYGNKVLKRITETRREQTRLKGVATISFTISKTGKLERVIVVKTSGSARLDKIAVNHIRRSEPFPIPPVGARRSFSIRFSGS